MSPKNDNVRAMQRIALIGTTLCWALLTVIQICFYLTGYEFDSDLYMPGVLPTVTAILWIAAAVGALLLCLRLPGKTVCQEFRVKSTAFSDAASLVGAAALAGSALLPLLLKNAGTDPLGNLLTSAVDSDSTARTMLLLSIALALPAALHFILVFAKHRSYPHTACALLLWTAFSALRIYFDMRYLLMSPRRILHLVALIAVMLFLIAELRLARGIVTHRFYAATAAITVALAGCDAVTNLLLSATGKIVLGSELCTYLVLLAVALYAAAGLFSLCKEEKKAPTPSATEEVSAEPAAPTSEEESEAAE